MTRRILAAACIPALLAQGCFASLTSPNFGEGEEVLRAAPQGPAPRPVEPLKTNEPIHTLAILTGEDEAPYLPNWNPRTAFKDATSREGLGVGFMAGLNLLSLVPFFVATPPVLGGLLGLATIAGGLAGAADPGQQRWKPTADLMTLEAALGRMHPQAEVQQGFREEVERITRGPAPQVRRPAGQPQDQPLDYGALAQGAGTEAVADLQVVAFGLAGGEFSFSVGVFAGVRARVFRASDGILIYDKVIAQSPAVPLPESLPPGSYTMELVAMDDGRVFRYEVNQALHAIAHALATDPDLHLTPGRTPPPKPTPR